MKIALTGGSGSAGPTAAAGGFIGMIGVNVDVPETRKIYVKVGKKDSLATIAQRHKVSVAQIKSWNDLKQDKVSSGTRLELNVPNKATAGKAAPTRQVAKSAPAHRKAAPATVRKAKATASNSKTSKKRSS